MPAREGLSRQRTRRREQEQHRKWYNHSQALTLEPNSLRQRRAERQKQHSVTEGRARSPHGHQTPTSACARSGACSTHQRNNEYSGARPHRDPCPLTYLGDDVLTLGQVAPALGTGVYPRTRQVHLEELPHSRGGRLRRRHRGPPGCVPAEPPCNQTLTYQWSAPHKRSQSWQRGASGGSRLLLSRKTATRTGGRCHSG